MALSPRDKLSSSTAHDDEPTQPYAIARSGFLAEASNKFFPSPGTTVVGGKLYHYDGSRWFHVMRHPDGTTCTTELLPNANGMIELGF